MMKKAVILQSRKTKGSIVYSVTIPKEFAEKLNLQKGDILFIELHNNKIIIYKP